MCGRFTLRTRPAELVKFFNLAGLLPDVSPRWNVAPTQQVIAVRRGRNGREPSWLRWGLIPAWAKDTKIASSLINARADTVAGKPSFRSAFKQRRCLVIADAYYEWKRVGKENIPYMMTMRNESPFAFAGIWERWEDGSSETIESCSNITTEPNALTAMIHDRMPVILPADSYDVWLDPSMHDIAKLQELLRPYPPEEMISQEVSKIINNARNEVDPRLPALGESSTLRCFAE